MAWRVVKSLLTLRDQINAAHPNRVKGADGTIGDAAHQAESTSDHDPHTYTALGSMPVVCALDITHDPAHGCDTYTLADTIRASRDPRIGYIISNRRIASNHPVGSYPAWAWRPYTGTGDPHTNHMHVSTVHDGRADGQQAWTIGAAPSPPPVPTSPAGEPTMFLIKAAGNATVYLSDGGHTTGIDGPLFDYLKARLPFYEGVDPKYFTQMTTFAKDTPAALTLTDAQITAITDRLIASNTNGLTPADHAGIKADIEAVVNATHLTTN